MFCPRLAAVVLSVAVSGVVQASQFSSNTIDRVHVSPEGNDKNPGTAARPVTTLVAARDVARRTGAKAIELLNAHNWRAVVSDGWQGTHLTSECMNLLCEGWGDEAHPDTALAGVFTDYILGVRPTAPGYATYVVDPIPAPGITWAKGCVPTPRGIIRVEWHLADGRLDVKVSGPSGGNAP